MAMKLLPKKEIDKAKAENKRQEIDEGKKLIKQIEVIRQTRNDEEQSLERFRRETLISIKAELAPYEEKLNTLKKEVDEAKREREELLKPLELEWEEVNKVKDEVETLKQDTLISLNEVEVLKGSYTHLLTEAEDIKARYLSCEETAQVKLNNAIIIERQAKELKEEAEKTKRQTDIYTSEKLAHITEEERKLDLRTTALIENEKKNKAEAEELRKEKILLADERATLERSLKRLNKQKNGSTK